MAKKGEILGRNSVTAPGVDTTFGFPGRIPKLPKHREYLLAYARTGVHEQAAEMVGYPISWAQAYGAKTIERYSDYLAWIQAFLAQQGARAIQVDQAAALEEMRRIGFANEADYFVLEPEADGQRRARRKRVDELTREQLTAVTIIYVKGSRRDGRVGILDWKWRDRDAMLLAIGKHLGMFNERIQHEHRHSHLHVAFDLSKASMKDLEALEGQFEQLLGEADAQK